MKMPELSKSNLTKLVGLVIAGFVVWLIFSCSTTVKEPVIIEQPVIAPIEEVIVAPVEELAPIEVIEPVVEPVVEPIAEPVVPESTPSDTTKAL